MSFINGTINKLVLTKVTLCLLKGASKINRPFEDNNKFSSREVL